MRYEDRKRLEGARSNFLLQVFPWRKQVQAAYNEVATVSKDAGAAVSHRMGENTFWEWLDNLAPGAAIPDLDKPILQRLYSAQDPNSEVGIDLTRVVEDLERYERDQCMNPEMQFDVLPQPYRMIVKVLEEDILEAAWDKIVLRMPKTTRDSTSAAASLLPRITVGEKLDLLPEKEEILVSCGVTTKQAILLCTSANKLYFAELNRSVELIQFETTPLVMVSKEYREPGVQLVAVSFQYDDADNSRLFELRFYELCSPETPSLVHLATLKSSELHAVSTMILSEAYGEFALYETTSESRRLCTYKIELPADDSYEESLATYKSRALKEDMVVGEPKSEGSVFAEYVDASTLVYGVTTTKAFSVFFLTASDYIERTFSSPLTVTALELMTGGFVAVGLEDGSFFLYNCHTNYVRALARKCVSPVSSIFFCEPFVICSHGSGDLLFFDSSTRSWVPEEIHNDFDPMSDLVFVGKIHSQGVPGRLHAVVKLSQGPLVALVLCDENDGEKSWRVEIVDADSAARLSFLYHSNKTKEGEILRSDEKVSADGRWNCSCVAVQVFGDEILVGNGHDLREFDISQALATAVKPLHSAYRLQKLEKHPFLALVSYFYANTSRQERYSQESCSKTAQGYREKMEREASTGALSRSTHSTSKQSRISFSKSRASSVASPSLGVKSISRLTSLASSAKIKLEQNLEKAVAIEWPSRLESFTMGCAVDSFEESRKKTMVKRERYLAWRLKELQSSQ